MIGKLTLIAAFIVVPPLVAGLLSFVTQLHVVRDRKTRTGAGWDAFDTFEIKDAMLGAIAWLAPAGMIFVCHDWLRELSTWQWLAALFAIGLPFMPYYIWYGRWSVAQRKAFEEAAARNHAPAAPAASSS